MLGLTYSIYLHMMVHALFYKETAVSMLKVNIHGGIHEAT